MPSYGSTTRKRGFFTSILTRRRSWGSSRPSTMFTAIRKVVGSRGEHPEDARHFFDEVARGLDGIDSVLIVGPASAKHEFFKFAQEKHGPLVSRIVGVEPADHPTGGEIVAHARHYFKASDRMGSIGVGR